MRYSIRLKIILILVIITVIPLAIIGYISYASISTLGENSIRGTLKIGKDALHDSTTSLKIVGEEVIRNKAVDVAKQVEIYIRSNPDMTVEDLQMDGYFTEIAVQKVGVTGYTALADSDHLINRFHVNPLIVGMDLESLSSTLPEFWSIMGGSRGGIDSYGYYDWKEADGSIRQKFMYIATVDARTADGVVFNVAATTYIDEFFARIEDNENRVKRSFGNIALASVTAIERTKREMVAVAIAALLVVIIWGILFAEALARPLRELTKAGNAIAEGRLDTPLPKISSTDEIKDLSNAMEILVGAVRFHKKRQEEPKESFEELSLKREQEKVLLEIDDNIEKIRKEANTDFFRD